MSSVQLIEKIKKRFNKKILVYLLISFVILIFLSFGIREGLQNQTDPLWFHLDSLLVGNGIKDTSINIKLSKRELIKYKISTIKDKESDLDSIYSILHKNATDTISLHILISKPFLPNWEYAKFVRYINPLIKKKRIVISGVSGAGKSTLVDRLAKFIAGNPTRIKQLQCTERMELEYHREWVGTWTPQGFIKGKLLDYLEKCKADSNHNYVFILDDFDKIYPSAFFGSELWNELDNPQDYNAIDGYGEVSFPNNFYLIAVTHVGVSNVVTLNDEHFRRLGEPYPLNADYREFFLYVLERIEKKKLEPDFQHIKKLVYFFSCANKLIEEKYGKDYSLGQWSTLKSYIKPDEFDKFVNTFITHVNSFKPAKELTLDDFEPFFYSIESNGLHEKTYFFYNMYLILISTGLFSEIAVAAGVGLISAIFGWIFFRKKKKLLEDFQFDVITIAEDFKNNKIGYDNAMQMMVAKKQHLENMILKKEIKYEEITFLLIFIDDQLKKIVEFNKTDNVVKDFNKTIEDFMSDGVLDQDEFNILTKFLENLRSALSPEIYYNLKNKIESLKNQ